MKYKVGDKVKVIKDLDTSSDTSKEMYGKVGSIIKINISPNITFPYTIKIGGLEECFREGEFIKIGKTKEKPIKYVIFYDENDHDPMQTFSELKEVKTWIKDNLSNGDIDFDSIRIFEVKKELKFKKSINIQIK